MLYERPWIQVIKLQLDDVITTSAGGFQNPEQPGDDSSILPDEW